MLVTIIAVGLMTLSTIALRSSNQGQATALARANARLALMLALGDLQKTTGDDRRITVDGSIYDGAKNPNVVGVWKSWSPRLAENPTARAPDYNSKNQQFVGWLTSSQNPTELASMGWSRTGKLLDPIPLFNEKSDGFTLAGSRIDLNYGTPQPGALAWSIMQNATRAKINVAGPENNQRQTNVDLQAQPRPSVAKSAGFKQPVGGWDQRASRVISMRQAELDAALWKAKPALPEGSHFTTQGYGLLTDIVNGGLKTDLSLGFEMSDADFQKDLWVTFKNPFRARTYPRMGIPSSYRGERPLFKTLTDSGSVHVDLNFSPANTVYEFPAAAVPTFNTLRSFYRTPYHIYNTADGPTLFERGMDHVALKQPVPAAGQYLSPCATPLAKKSQTSYRPVLDRVLFVLSAGVSADPATLNEVRLIITPIVTLWNPYNVALEIEGAVVYQWLDAAHYPNWTFYQNGSRVDSKSGHMASLLSLQFLSVGHGRTVDPYFYFSITPNGVGTAGSGKSIRFQPGEVRVFAPVGQQAQELFAHESIRNRTLPLRQVDSVDQLSLRGGFAVQMKNSASGGGFSRVLASSESVQISFSANGVYPFGVGLEDATRTKLSNPGVADRGQAVTDVQTANFIGTDAAATLVSGEMSYAEVANPATRQPFGMFETYHRVANDAAAFRRADLVYTTNPRQAHVNRFLTTGSFMTGPNYETRMTQVSSFNQVIQTTNGGRSAYYGGTNSPVGGATHLPFFEAPRSPLLSLAAFQHADLAGTSYSPAYQFANSWASAYLAKEKVAELTPTETVNIPGAAAQYTRADMPVYDYSYLANESLWDSFFFSGAAPKLLPGSGTGSPAAWDRIVATVSEDYKTTLELFIDDPSNYFLRNPRMRFLAGRTPKEKLKKELLTPQGCLQIAASLQVDGAFNINSTSEKAWTAFLSGIRDLPFEVIASPKAATKAQSNTPAKGNAAFSRLRNPFGVENHHWMGFRTLTEAQVEDLAKRLVQQIRKRGPFLSIGEFVNRRVDSSPYSLKGAIQSAIDDAGFNKPALYGTVDTSGYPDLGRSNINPANTGVGIPGYLTQGDVLQSIAPVITARSDSFTIRGYGEAKDPNGLVTATAWCEAVVQRDPEFVDPSNPPHATIATLTPTNQIFGRRYTIISFRYLTKSEVGL